MARRLVLVGFCIAVLGGVANEEVRAGCSNDASYWGAMKKVWVELSADNEKSLVIAAWMANSPEQRARGFQGVCRAFVIKRSLLFSFPVPVHAKFHMTGVVAPLDIAFIDAYKQVIDIQRMTQQESNQPIKYYRPKAEFHFALETAAGRLDRLRRNPVLWRMRISTSSQ